MLFLQIKLLSGLPVFMPCLRSISKEEEAVALTNFRQRFKAQKSLDLDDDMEFCPNLLTESDHISINSSSSDRSSLSSGSPESSPHPTKLRQTLPSLSIPTPILTFHLRIKGSQHL